MRSLVVFCLAINSSTLCFAGKYSDSLVHVIHTTQNLKARIDALNAYAYEFRRGDIDSGIAIANEACQLSKKANYHTGLGDYYDCIGSFFFNDNPDTALILFRNAVSEYIIDKNTERVDRQYASISNVFIVLAQYDSALYYAQKTLQDVQSDKALSQKEKTHKCMWLYQSLGNIFYYLSYYDSSIIYSERGLRIAEKDGDKNAQSTFLITISNVHAQQEDYAKAVYYGQQAAKLDLDDGNYQGYILCLTNIASHLCDTKDYEAALVYADSARKAAIAHSFFKHIAHNYQTYGDVYMAQGHNELALQAYLKGLEYCSKYPNGFLEYGLLRNVGDVYLKLNSPKIACDYFTRSLAKCEDDREVRELCYEGLTDAYEQLKDYKAALHYARLSRALKDSIFNENAKETINELNIKYETGKKEQQIRLLSKENDLKAAIARKQEQQKYFAYFSLVLFIGFGSMSFYRLRRRKKIEKEQALLEERLRISRDLHDDMGATLSSISVYSTAVKQRLSDSKTEEAVRMLDKISEDSREMVANMSDMVWMIKPGNDTMEQLFDRVQLFASNVLAAKRIFFRFDIEEALKEMRVDMEVKKNIFLIAKEALNNSVKYSDCRTVEVAVNIQNGELNMSIFDDGSGFDMAMHVRGNGLKNMEERAMKLGGKMSLDTERGKGTKVSFLFPLPQNGE